MGSKAKEDFFHVLDEVFLVERPKENGLGEDSYFCSHGENSAIISVFDGCGGAGARVYEKIGRHTGAYIASRIVSGAVHDWYFDNRGLVWKNSSELADSMKRYIEKGYDQCTRYAGGSSRIRGSLFREFPTTAAIGYIQNSSRGILLHVIWAGDSRVYLMDGRGLAQLSGDDIEGEDAFTNLYNDGVLTNVLSSDKNYALHSKSILLSEPALVLTATDGCFGYLSSPMEFEYLLLESLEGAETPEAFRKTLNGRFQEYAGDDYSFCMAALGFGTFRDMKHSFRKRSEYMKDAYMNLLEKDRSMERLQALWQKYRTGYERLL